MKGRVIYRVWATFVMLIPIVAEEAVEGTLLEGGHY